jgi:deoxyadenosine/deoxycytidine kinase
VGKLIAVVGTSGVGKTTLVRALCMAVDFAPGLEEHGTRPFQALFKNDPRYALANQMDYLLLRARQEQELRQGTKPGLLDGGLEMDFHGFTRLFHARGWLTNTEYQLCKDFYYFIRNLLPPPDLVISLKAGRDIIAERLRGRNRINIASTQEISLLDSFLDEWLATVNPERILYLDNNRDDPEYKQEIPHLLMQIEGFFGKI